MSNLPRPPKALAAELALVALLIGYGPFSVFRLVLLLLLASQSLWIRGLGWPTVGLNRPPGVYHTALQGVVGGLLILVLSRVVILPVAVWLTGTSIDLSALGELEDTRGWLTLMLYAWTLAAFGEEMVFRGYLIRRLVDLTGTTRIAWGFAIVASGAAFGVAHSYQGPAGVLATAVVGVLMGLLYLYAGRNLWTVIIAHATVDTVALSAIYLGHRSLVFP